MCEALEEVFKRLQFRVVDLEQTSLDEDVSACILGQGHQCGPGGWRPQAGPLDPPPKADALETREPQSWGCRESFWVLTLGSSPA